MQRSKFAVCAMAALVALAMACSRQSASPTSPSSAAAANTSADPGVTLKVTAPTPSSPADGSTLGDGVVPTLSASAASGTFAATALSYRFQLFSDSGATLHDVVAGGPSFPVTADLDYEKRFTWRVRAELNGSVGPWSATWSFITPAGAYIRGNEIRDPLSNGKTVGRAFGCTFIPGVGIRLDGKESYVEYQLQVPLEEGEFSAIMTNIGNGTEQWKTKVMSMLQGDGVNITDNNYRVTLDKRTNWAGQVSPFRYTMRSRGVDSGEPNSGAQSWDRSHLYLFKFTWAGGQSRGVVLDGGANGFVKANVGTGYKAPYSPNPHLVRLGSVGGRAGSDTNPNTIIRNVWVSNRPRPAFPGDNP
jgi:hypothetical protein